MKKSLAALFMLLLCLFCMGCAQKPAAALALEEFFVYPDQGDPISPADTGGEFTLHQDKVSTGSSPADAYEGQHFHSKRGIAPGSSLEQLAEAYPDLRFNVIYGKSEQFKVETGVSPKKVAQQAKKGKDIVFVLYSQRSVQGEKVSDKEFDAYCKEKGVNSAELASNPDKYGYECWSMIYGIHGQSIESISFTGIRPAQAAE